MYYTTREVYEFISKQNDDPIVEWKTCAISGQSFAIYQSDINFYTKISPTFAGQRFAIPTPTLCPEERQRRRLSFRNERKLYKRKCDFSGKDIISIYSPDKPYKIYDQKNRRSDDRDPMDYGKEFNFSESFTEQFNELIYNTPRANFYGKNNENSNYNNHCSYVKNCYMSADCIQSESCLYTTTGIECINVVDSELITTGENCYYCIGSDHIYNCMYCIQSNNCHHCIGLINCKNCEYCFQCSHISEQKYCINNKQYTQDEYEKYVKEFKAFPIISFTHGQQLSNSQGCYGNQIFNSKNSILSHTIYNSTNIKYSFTVGWMDDSYDCYETGLNCSLLYENHAVTGSHKVCYASISYDNTYCFYIDNCYNCQNCFGCIGLRHKQYCIFNKQYTKEEYEATVAKIITHMQETGEWGEFFHPSLSPFGYNETVAQEYYPMEKVGTHIHASGDTKKDYKQYGYKRSDYNADPIIPNGAEVIDRKTNPDVSGLTDEQTLAKIYLCEVTNRPYRIISQELAFYHKHHLPLPRRHPDQRHADRMALRAPRELHLRQCDKCGDTMLSVYSDNETKKIYCESCYQKEIYS